MPPIIVHEKALGHLSRGLYRSPASALRELVSNCWDANARKVRIETNYPNFFQISVQDDGDGFTEQEFVRLMAGGIGNSEKRVRENTSKRDRPTIGRLGIGMLGIAQMCGSFLVISKTKNRQGFRARVRLYDLLKERLDNDDSEVVLQKTEKDGEAYREVDVGEYSLEKFSPDECSLGTIIIADEVHPTFIHSFQQSVKFENFKQPSLDWKTNLGIVSQYHSLQELGDYWRLLWELSAACPVPYIGKKAVPGNLIAAEQRRLIDYDFEVLVDSISLRKPIYIDDPGIDFSTYPIKMQSKRVYGKTLRYHGYILVSEGSQLKPDELRGIMIRIKNVGIGYYDPSLLDYRYNEGPRTKWVTGEMYVDDGLEDALNIDRDSFNRFHPQFRVIQEYLHNLLREEVFPKSWKKIDVRSAAKRKVKEEARKKITESVIGSYVEQPVRVVTSSRSSESTSAPVALQKTSKQVTVNLPVELQTKKSNKQLAASILAIFEVSLQEKTNEARRETFQKLLLDLLRRW